MPIQTSCPSCAKGYNLADAMKGKHVKCKNCAHVFLVGPVAAKTYTPAKSPTATTTSKGPGAPAPKKTSPKPADDDIVDVLPADDEDEDLDEQDRPARKGSKTSPAGAKKKGSGMLWLLLGGGGAVGFLFLIACMGGLWYLFGSGLGKTIDMATYKKLYAGMPESEVAALLGQPTTTRNGGDIGFGAFPGMNLKTSIWKGGGNEVIVVFTDGKASFAQGTFKEAKGGSTTLTGFFGTSPLAQNPPPPQNPPPSPPPIVPPVTPPPNNPPPPPRDRPPPKDRPSRDKPPPPPTFHKVSEVAALSIQNGFTKDRVLLITSKEEPTSKTPGNVKTPNGATASETWTWNVEKGYLKVYFDKNGKVVDKESKDLPQI
jgi:hypothetical protein